DEGQLIKAIGAVKIILEIDPKNGDAQKQLQEMNERRFGKVTLESAGLKPKAGVGAGARATSAIELAEAGHAAHSVGSALQPGLAAGEDEPLELDDGKPSPPRKGAAPAAGPSRAIAPLPPKKKPPAPPKPAVTISDEITIEDEAEPRPPPKKAIATPPPPMHGGAQPIADLLSSEAEEEVELLSITSDEEAAGERPMANAKVSPDEADLDAAFGNISPQAAVHQKKVPTTKVPLFDDLTQEAFVELVNKLEYHRHVPGQLIIREGDPGRSFYVIVEGKVRIYKVGPDEKEITLAQLGEGAFFGEMALLSGAPRTANVVAEEDTEILEVTDVVLRELAGKHPQVINSLKNFYRQRRLNNVMA